MFNYYGPVADIDRSIIVLFNLYNFFFLVEKMSYMLLYDIHDFLYKYLYDINSWIFHEWLLLENYLTIYRYL